MKIITRVRDCTYPKWWHGHCYFDHTTREAVMAPIGLHLIIRSWWSFCLRYWRWAWGPCFLDAYIRDLMEIRAENSKLIRNIAWMDVEIRILRAEVLKHAGKEAA